LRASPATPACRRSGSTSGASFITLQRRHTASEPAPPAPQLGPQHQPTACPDSPTRLPIPELEHMCTAVRAGNTTASRPDSALFTLAVRRRRAARDAVSSWAGLPRRDWRDLPRS
jgi:hypothetical protein